jgi:hypothetical protein
MSFAGGHTPLLALKLPSAGGITEQDTECPGPEVLLGFEVQAPKPVFESEL